MKSNHSFADITPSLRKFLLSPHERQNKKSLEKPELAISLTKNAKILK